MTVNRRARPLGSIPDRRHSPRIRRQSTERQVGNSYGRRVDVQRVVEASQLVVAVTTRNSFRNRPAIQMRLMCAHGDKIGRSPA